MADDDEGHYLWEHCPDAHACEEHDDADSGSQGLAFGLLTAAGAATLLGAIVICALPSETRHSNQFLVAGLASAAGVLMFLVIAEIYPAADASWCCVTPHHEGASVATFLAGVALAALLHAATDRVVAGGHAHGKAPTEASALLRPEPLFDEAYGVGDAHVAAVPSAWTVALGLSLHNVPEGLLLYWSVVDGGDTGKLFFLAVALHNVPIGAVIASTVLATGRPRWKALATASAVGASFLLAGVIAHASGSRLRQPTTQAVAFAVMSGILVFICLQTLLPAAFGADESRGKAVVVASFFFGVTVMAAALTAVGEMSGHMH